MREIPIPNYTDSQMQVFFWEIDEFIPSVAIMAIFIMLWNQAFIGLGLAYVFTNLFSRFKSGNMEGVLFHICWWVGAFKMNNRFDTGLAREFVK